MRTFVVNRVLLLAAVLGAPAIGRGDGAQGEPVERARAASAAGDFEAAREAWLEAAAGAENDAARARATYRAAVLAYDRLGETELALEALRRLVTHHPDALQAPRALRRLALETEPGPARIAFYRTAYRSLGRSPLGPEIAWRCGRHAEDEDLHTAALLCYRRVVEHHPTHPHAGDARFRIAEILRRLDRPEAAAAVYRSILLEPAPRHAARPLDRAERAVGPGLPHRRGARHGPAAWLGLGQALRAAGETAAAEAAFGHLLHLHPDHTRLRTEALRHLAHLRAARGDLVGAERAWRRLLDEAPWSRYAAEAEAALQ